MNGDGLTDIILTDGMGSPKETIILAACGKERYYPLFHEMADGVTVEGDPDPKRTWKILRFEYWRVGATKGEIVVKRWDGTSYAPCCEHPAGPRPARDCCP